MLEWGDLTEKSYLSQKAKDAMMRFRNTYKQLLSNDHTLTIRLHLATKSIHPPSESVKARVEELNQYIKSKLSTAEVVFVPWGCATLMKALRSSPQKKLTLEKVQVFSMPDSSVVCLATVAKFADFLDDGTGQIRQWLLEPNVRDYIATSSVNKQIRATLNQASWTEDFWWLNNGVTILSDNCSVAGDTLSIENPELVNGLQTSNEIFRARANTALSKRHVLVKIIVAPDDRSKNAIIKATNSQTYVNPLSLKATDPLQFDIEDRLFKLGLFYDRKKGKYRRLKKPIKNIISIKEMGQAVIAAYLQRPADSRGRPESLLNSEKHSPTIFSEDHGLEFYASCILLDRLCANYVNQKDVTADVKIDIRFYVTMLAACSYTSKASPTARDIAELLPQLRYEIPEGLLARCFDEAIAAYNDLGGTDKVAKGANLQAKLLESVTARLAGGGN